MHYLVAKRTSWFSIAQVFLFSGQHSHLDLLSYNYWNSNYSGFYFDIRPFNKVIDTKIIVHLWSENTKIVC